MTRINTRYPHTARERIRSAPKVEGLSRLRRPIACALALGLIFGMVAVLAPAARASNNAEYLVQISASCRSGGLCLGFTSLRGSCDFVGTTSGGSEASCHALLTGDGLVATESIAGTWWDLEFSPSLSATTGVDDFFITAGTVTFTGPTAVGALAAGVPQALGCSVTGATFTCTIPALESIGQYTPDTFDPVILGHYASHVCFDTGVIDPGCSFIQQATLLG